MSKKDNPFAGVMQKFRAAQKLKAAQKSNDVAAPAEQDPSELAKRIIASAARARGVSPDAPAAQTGLARQIVDAAAVAAGGGHVREKPRGVAAEIIAAGEKRRGLSRSNK